MTLKEFGLDKKKTHSAGVLNRDGYSRENVHYHFRCKKNYSIIE